MNDISPTSPGEISTVVGSVNALFVGLDEGAAHGGHASDLQHVRAAGIFCASGIADDVVNKRSWLTNHSGRFKPRTNPLAKDTAMSDKAKTMFHVLTTCGTLCILGSLAAVSYVYLQTYDRMWLPITPSEMPRTVAFFAFVVVPAAAVGLVGLGMVVGGAWVAIRDGLQ